MLCTSLLTDAIGALALLPMPAPTGTEGALDSPTFVETLSAAHSDAEELPLAEESDAREQNMTMPVTVPVFVWRPPLELAPLTELEPVEVHGLASAPPRTLGQMPAPVSEVAISGTIGVEARTASSRGAVEPTDPPQALPAPDPTMNATVILAPRARPAEADAQHVEFQRRTHEDVDVLQPRFLSGEHAPASAEPLESLPTSTPAAQPKQPYPGRAEPAVITVQAPQMTHARPDAPPEGRLSRTPEALPAVPRDNPALEPQLPASPPQADDRAMTRPRPSAAELPTMGMRAADHVSAVQRPATPPVPPARPQQAAPEGAVPVLPNLARAEARTASASERPRVRPAITAPSAPAPTEQPDRTPPVQPLIKTAATVPKVPVEQDNPASKIAPERDTRIEIHATPEAAASTLYASTTVRAAPQADARPQPDTPRAAAPPPPPQMPDTVQAPRPVEKISFSVGGSDGQPRAEILLQHKPDGAIQMAVRTPDAHFAQSLRSGVSELNATLESRGYRSELQAAPLRESAGDQQDQPHRRPRWFYERNDDDN